MEYVATFADGHKASTLAHYGVPHQKWGVRRWQNKDGSLTPEGRIHYGRIAERKPDFSNITGAIGGAAGAGQIHAGPIGALAGGAAGALVGYAVYRAQKHRYDTANKKLQEDSKRRQEEYEQSDEYKEYLGKLKNEGSRLNSGGAKSLKNSGKTIEEVAKILGVPRSTAADYIYY